MGNPEGLVNYSAGPGVISYSVSLFVSRHSGYLQLPSLNLYHLLLFVQNAHFTCYIVVHLQHLAHYSGDVGVDLRSLISSWSDKRYNYPSRLQCQKVVRALNSI